MVSVEETSPFPFAKSCDSCGEWFACRADAISECHCSSVSLRPEQQRIIRNKFHDCLCGTCLNRMSEEPIMASE